jgi:enoyl-CoA hydratase/carnithine racemase
MTHYPHLLLDIQQHTALVTISNPPANTWNADSLNGLIELVHELNANRDIYALVLTGEGSKFFSAGADLNMFADGDPAVARKMARLFGQAFETLTDFRGVSIAAINGYAMGGGLEVALACDIRIAEQQAKLGLPEASVGLLPCAGGTQRLTELVGPGWAKRMILCGEKVSATLAYEMGLVEEVVTEGHAWTAAQQMAQRVERQSPSALRACKRLINQGRSGHRDAALPLERSLFLALFDDANQKTELLRTRC